MEGRESYITHSLIFLSGSMCRAKRKPKGGERETDILAHPVPYFCLVYVFLLQGVSYFNAMLDGFTGMEMLSDVSLV